eukprot:4720675-Pyramimonas_sp.AAC.1
MSSTVTGMRSWPSGTGSLTGRRRSGGSSSDFVSRHRTESSSSLPPKLTPLLAASSGLGAAQSGAHQGPMHMLLLVVSPCCRKCQQPHIHGDGTSVC